MNEEQYEYKFSVVMPVYNAEKYIDDAMESIINQTIGFENIQVILVNDGSTDNSEQICLEYKEKYPENVIYVKQENAGVSAARNNGTKYVKGEYINYLDSDDKWDLDVFEKAYNMFKKRKTIDVIGVRQRFFEAQDGYPSLDYKFYRDRFVDIFEEYDCIQLSVTSGFIRTSAMKGKAFDTRIKFSEDAKLLYEIILEKEEYGIISSSIHWYRKRHQKNSAIQTATTNISWYLDTTKLSYMYVFELSKKKYGKIIPFVQYYVMYDLQWRLMTRIPEWFTEEQKEDYINTIKDLLRNIDDNIILMQRNIWIERKIYFLCLKYGSDIRKKFEYDKGKILFNNLVVNNIKNKNFLEINIFEIQGAYLYLEGKIKDYYPEEDCEIYIKDNLGNIYHLEYYDMPIDDQIAFTEERFFKGRGFKAKIPLEGVKSMRIMMRYKKEHNRRLCLNFSKLSNLSKDIQEFYLQKEDYIITTKCDKIFIKKSRKKRITEYELKYLQQLFKEREYNIIRYRLYYHIYRKILKRPIWIFSDRVQMASDNGMYMFEYVTKNHKEINAYFMIDKKSPDYKKIKKIGKVLKFDSFKYKLYFLLSSKIISSQSDEWVTNAFGEKEIYVRDLYKFKFVFLQHGITKDDLSKWLHKQNKNIKLFVTTTKREYDSIVYGNYGYTENEVKLTGFPRYDNLKNDTKKKIIFMPTWRANLVGPADSNSGKREYNVEFKNSEYCEFYNKLINDKRILETLSRYGYTAKFFVHPCLKEQYIDFKGNDIIEVSRDMSNYQKEFSENALLITDFSSVAFDFTYLKKPVIYTQFDIKTFFQGQVDEKGYFDYEKDGFGPVCYDYEDTVNEIVKAIEGGCKLEEKYLERIENLYEYFDKNNCKRVYEEILKI